MPTASAARQADDAMAIDDTPSISVIIPVFDRPATLPRAIESVFSQQDIPSSAIEIIVVDDASPCPVMLDDIDDPRLRIVRLPCNLGAAGARNAGIRASRGRFLAFLDSDDLWLDGKLAAQLACFRALEREPAGPPIALTIALSCGFYYPDRRSGRLRLRIPRPADRLVDFASGCWFVPGTALFVRRDVFDTVGLFDERLRRLEDLDWFLRFGRSGGRLHVLTDAGVIIDPSRSNTADRVIHGSRFLRQKFAPDGEMPLPRTAWRRLRAYLALECAAALLFERRRLRGMWYLLKSLCLKPRLRVPLERFWQCSDAVPPGIARRYAGMSRERVRPSADNRPEA
ncbi:MAG: glycosyltransferase family 2 protein [Ectothiorhodospiraceae bacterium]|jgi:glycosyltransferase involved in cell wall biosynthesis|nr:glycosyltransferase family 2 protein [Ectothiorhodospiraceae bacterium]